MAGVSETLASFPRERPWLLPALHALQDAYGFLSHETLTAAGAHLRVPASEVYGVATHYPELRLAPRGRHHVRVCTGVTCALLGGRELLATLERRFGSVQRDSRVVPPSSPAPLTSSSHPDEVTLELADCFFECSVAPLVEVDGGYRGRVTLGDVTRIERWFSTRGGSPRHAPSVPAELRARAPRERGSLVDAGSAVSTLERLIEDAKARRAARSPLRLLVQVGTCGRAVGGDELLAALRAAVERRRLAAEIIEGACNGMCYAAPLIEVQSHGLPRFLIERLASPAVDAFLDCLQRNDASFAEGGSSGVVWAEHAWRGLTPVGEHPFWRAQERVLLRRAGMIDPESLDDALLAGAYRSLSRALDASPAWVIDQVKTSGLQGRGGAFFPAAFKWEACRKAAGEPKYIVMNGEEGEPGIFKDRHLMEGDPHQILEGVLLAAYAAGATHAILYVHGEANRSATRLARAVSEAESVGIVGPRMLGRDVGCTVELRRGAGGFVLGEETALLESIEGRRAQPRTRPPFPVESGLWGKPTVINNVETLSAIPSILERGTESFARLGTPKAPGTKVFGLSGPIRRPGVVEVRNGATLATLLEGIGGGLVDGRRCLGALVGGPSGSVVPATLFDVPMEPRERVSPGTGGIVAVPEGASIVDVVKTLLAFNAKESCGKCTPCREGTPRLLAMIDELAGSTEPERQLAQIRELADAVQLASLCGLGQAAPLALLRALEIFPEQFVRQ